MNNFEGKKVSQEQGAYRKMELDLKAVTALHLAVLTRVKQSGLLNSSWMVENGKGTLHFQITSKLSAADYFNRYTLSPSGLRDMISEMLKQVKNLDQYFLNPEGLIQEFDQLYVDPHSHQLFMMYDPSPCQSADHRAIEKTYRLIRHILMEKVKLENGDGMDAFIILMNGLKSPESESYREAIEQWLMTDSLELEREKQTEVITTHGSVDILEIIPQNEDSYFSPLKDTPILTAKVPIQKPVKHDDKIAFNGAVLKRLIMIAAIVMMLGLVGVSLTRKVGLIECVTAVLAGAGVSFAMEWYRWKKVRHGANVESEIEEPWEEGNLYMGASNLSDNHVKALYFEEGVTVTEADNFKNSQSFKQEVSNLRMEDNRTVMLEAAVRYPTLKAINVGVEDIEIKQERILIGRCGSSSDVILSSNTVGRIHAEVLCCDKNLKVKDFNTLNGTYVNEVRVGDGYYDLENMDTLRFSCFEFRVVMP